MGKEGVHGEGNYDATRKYNAATKRFVDAGKVDKAAHDAAPASDAEALQLAAAEAEGKSRAKEEDPLLTRKARGSQSRSDEAQPRSRGEGNADTPETAPEDTRTPKPGEDA
jgi:hypothetical protein